MLGAVIGDIVGSRFEWNNIRIKEFDFFHQTCTFTDDSVMTLAIASAILEAKGNSGKLGNFAVLEMRRLGNLYPGRGYGGMFNGWLHSDAPEPYNSFGNGSAMRVSACGFAGKSLEEVKLLSRKVTEVTHNHPEGLKGAEATAVCVFLARQGKMLWEIGDYVKKHYYPLDFTLDGIRDSYRFNETCQNTVPQAIVAFLESENFEDAIRNAISIGGDSDTLAAITGAMAEAYYGIPMDLRERALAFLDEELLKILNDFESAYPYKAENSGESRLEKQGKTLVIYYSFEGNCKAVADQVVRLTGADTLRLMPIKESESKGFFSKYMWGGRQVLSGEKPELEPYDIDFSDYEVIILGTPVWAWGPAPVLKSFLSNEKFSGKKILLYCCHGGGSGKTLAKIKAELEGNEFLGELEIREPLKKGTPAELEQKVKEWLKSADLLEQ